MRTVRLSEAHFEVVVRLLAEQWASKATLAAVPVDEGRIWNHPFCSASSEARRKRAKLLTTQAASLSRALWQFGVETPPVDVGRYVVPKPVEGSSRPGDTEYQYRLKNVYVRELEAAVVAVAKATRKEEPLP